MKANIPRKQKGVNGKIKLPQKRQRYTTPAIPNGVVWVVA
jgi:hypothetical protein